MCSVTDRLSLTGSVLAMHATAVKPPAAAAMVPVATVSLYSWPGSRRWTCMSISPGATTSPVASRTAGSPPAPCSPRCSPRSRRAPRSPPSPSRSRSITAVTTPSSISRSWAPSRPWLGSISLPFAISSRPEGAPEPAAAAVGVGAGISGRLLVHAGEQVEHGHPHRDAVRDLLEDHRVRTVGHLAGDLDAAVHRPGVHDDHVVGRPREARA